MMESWPLQPPPPTPPPPPPPRVFPPPPLVVAAFQGFGTCQLPAGTRDYSIIAKEDAVIAASAVSGGLAVGGTLADGSPQDAASVDRPSYVQRSVDSTPRFRWNGGIIAGRGIPFQWRDFEALANRLETASFDYRAFYGALYRVDVVDQGGTYSSTDSACVDRRTPPEGAGGEDNGRTLLVFTGEGTICLTSDDLGRQFGPSVLAPFARVLIDGSVGFIDGFVVARSVGSVGQFGESVQLHNDGYKGEMQCRPDPPPSPPKPPPPFPPPPPSPPWFPPLFYNNPANTNTIPDVTIAISIGGGGSGGGGTTVIVLGDNAASLGGAGIVSGVTININVAANVVVTAPTSYVFILVPTALQSTYGTTITIATSGSSTVGDLQAALAAALGVAAGDLPLDNNGETMNDPSVTLDSITAGGSLGASLNGDPPSDPFTVTVTLPPALAELYGPTMTVAASEDTTVGELKALVESITGMSADGMEMSVGGGSAGGAGGAGSATGVTTSPTGGSLRSVPALFDVDGDGDQDVLVGGADGTIRYFERQDDNSLVEKTGDDNPFAGIDVGFNCAPTLGDVNADGIVDLVTGSADGRVRVFSGQSDGTFDPTAVEVVDTFTDEVIDVGSDSVPTLTDLNGRGGLDLMVGSASGEVHLFYGLAAPGSFSGPGGTFSSGPGRSPLLAADGSPVTTSSCCSAPALGDIDGDGDNDLILGSGAGSFDYYENTGSSDTAEFTEVPPDSPRHPVDLANMPSGYSTPVLADLNNDGDVELMAGSADGSITLFEPNGGASSGATGGAAGPSDSVPDFFPVVGPVANGAPKPYGVRMHVTLDLPPAVAQLGREQIGAGLSNFLESTLGLASLGLAVKLHSVAAITTSALEAQLGAPSGSVQSVLSVAERNAIAAALAAGFPNVGAFCQSDAAVTDTGLSVHCDIVGGDMRRRQRKLQAGGGGEVTQATLDVTGTDPQESQAKANQAANGLACLLNDAGSNGLAERDGDGLLESGGLTDAVIPSAGIQRLSGDSSSGNRPTRQACAVLGPPPSAPPPELPLGGESEALTGDDGAGAGWSTTNIILLILCALFLLCWICCICFWVYRRREPLGLHWEVLGSTRPDKGKEVVDNFALLGALRKALNEKETKARLGLAEAAEVPYSSTYAKAPAGSKLGSKANAPYASIMSVEDAESRGEEPVIITFSHEEFKDMEVRKLRKDSFVAIELFSCTLYLRPVPKGTAARSRLQVRKLKAGSVEKESQRGRLEVRRSKGDEKPMKPTFGGGESSTLLPDPRGMSVVSSSPSASSSALLPDPRGMSTYERANLVDAECGFPSKDEEFDVEVEHTQPVAREESDLELPPQGHPSRMIRARKANAADLKSRKTQAAATAPPRPAPAAPAPAQSPRLSAPQFIGYSDAVLRAREDEESKKKEEEPHEGDLSSTDDEEAGIHGATMSERASC